MTVATVGYTHGLAAQGIGFTQTPRIALGTDAFPWLAANLVVSAGDIALRLAETFRSIQLVALVTATGAVQKALTMWTAQRTGGYAIVAIVEHEVIEALAFSSRQTEAILQAAITTVWHTS